MFFKDPANVFVVGVLIAVIAFGVFIKINSDKVEREEKARKEEKEREGKKKP